MDVRVGGGGGLYLANGEPPRTAGRKYGAAFGHEPAPRGCDRRASGGEVGRERHKHGTGVGGEVWQTPGQTPSFSEMLLQVNVCVPTFISLVPMFFQHRQEVENPYSGTFVYDPTCQ